MFKHRSLVVSSAVLFLLCLVALALSIRSVVGVPGVQVNAATHVTAFSNDYTQAGLNVADGRCDKAVGFYLHAIQSDGPTVAAYSGLAGCYNALGKPFSSIREYDNAIALDPTNYGLYLSRAYAEAAQGDNGVAIADDWTALRLSPKQAPSYISASDAFVSSQDLADALTAINLALALVPSNPTIYEKRAAIYVDMKDFAHAYQDYKTAEAIAPSNSTRSIVSNDLAVLYDQQGDYTSAYSAMTYALSLQPNNANFHVQLGNIRRDAGDYTGALEAYNLALKLGVVGPVAELANESKGDIYISINQLKLAVASYKEALNKTASLQQIQTLKSKLKQAQRG